MKNYFEFTIGDKTSKAYKSLDNVYEIEASGLNLAQIFLDIAVSGKILSFTDATKILDLSIKADVTDFKERSKFVNDYFNQKRFKACDEVSSFILNLLKTPKNDSDDTGDTEKK